MNLNGYLRLYCKIKEIPAPPKRCRVCNGELDAKWKARQHGHLCLRCLMAKRRLTK